MRPVTNTFQIYVGPSYSTLGSRGGTAKGNLTQFSSQMLHMIHR